MLSYNLSTITKIKTVKKAEATWWYWKPAHQKLFGLIKKPAGFYYTFTMGAPEFQKECPRDRYLENGRVYDNPHIIIWFTDGNYKIHYYVTAHQMMKAAEDIKHRSGCQWFEA